MDDASSLIGTLFGGRFRIESLLGSGSMGAVCLARHEVLQRRFAIKVLHRCLLSDLSVPARFRREARAAGRIEHPHITSVFDFGHSDEGRPYIVMEYVEGPTLADAIAREGPFPLPRAINMLLQISEALTAAHAVDVIHRDLKPRNIVLTTHQDQPDYIKILDFGVAKILGLGSSGLTSEWEKLGTPQYMPPEQCTGAAVDNRADIYSFGIVAFELLAGDVPFRGSLFDVIESHIHKEPPPLSKVAGREDIPAVVDSMVLRCLAKRPDDRYPNASALLAEIQSLHQSMLAGRSRSLTGEHVALSAALQHLPVPGVPGQAPADESGDPWEEPTAADWPRQGNEDPTTLHSHALQELACSVRDQGLGSLEISQALSLKLEAEDRVFELQSAIALIEHQKVEVEMTAREREAHLRQALNQLEHERIILQASGEEDHPRMALGNNPQPNEAPSPGAQLEERIIAVTGRIQQVSLQLEENVVALREKLAEKRPALAELYGEVDRQNGQLVELLRRIRSQIMELSDPDLSRLLDLAGV